MRDGMLPARRNLSVSLLCALLNASVPLSSYCEEATTSLLGRIEMVCVDSEATASATFQSHNQEVVSDRHGIFLTHIRSRNKPYRGQTWRLLRTRDGGRTLTGL